MKPWKCDICGKSIDVEDDYEPQMCCTGSLYEIHCGCMGKPINPMFCNDCEIKIFGEHLNILNV